MKRQIAVSTAALFAASSLAIAQGTPGGPAPAPGGTPPAQSAPPTGGTITPGPGGAPPTGIPEKMSRDPVGKAPASPEAREKSASERLAKDGKDMKDARETPPGSSGKAVKGAKAKDGGGAAAAAAPEEKKPQIRSAFQKHRVKPAQNVNVSINVGVAIPRTVTLYAVPQDVVVVYPAYRRYKYFLIDDRVCIVDPATFMIVDVIVLSA